MRSVGKEGLLLSSCLSPFVCERSSDSPFVEQSTQLGLSDTFHGIRRSFALRRKLSSQVLAVTVALHRGRVDISGDSVLSRRMEEGIPRFPARATGFGIFNRTHGPLSAERITRAVSASPVPVVRCSFCRKCCFSPDDPPEPDTSADLFCPISHRPGALSSQNPWAFRPSHVP